MALSVEVVKPLDGGRVQVDAKNKFFGKDVVTHYSVPKEKADEFIADYKKEENKRTANGIASCAITAGAMLLGGLASKKANVLLKGLSVILFGAAGAVASVIGFGMNNAKRLNNLFEKHDANPIVYLKDEAPAKDKKVDEKSNKPDMKPTEKTEDKSAAKSDAKPAEKPENKQEKIETPKNEPPAKEEKDDD